jgi:hypothetical protein
MTAALSTLWGTIGRRLTVKKKRYTPTNNGTLTSQRRLGAGDTQPIHDAKSLVFPADEVRAFLCSQWADALGARSPMAYVMTQVEHCFPGEVALHQVRNKDPLDYKQRGRQYEPFGNIKKVSLELVSLNGRVICCRCRRSPLRKSSARRAQSRTEVWDDVVFMSIAPSAIRAVVTGNYRRFEETLKRTVCQ